MSERIRVGIVGASPQSWAAAAHLPALTHLDELTVTAVATMILVEECKLRLDDPVDAPTRRVDPPPGVAAAHVPAW